MNSYLWEKIISIDCKYQLYHSNFETFSWLEKDCNITDIDTILNKNIMKGCFRNKQLNYSIIDTDNIKKSVRSHRLVFYAFNQEKITECNGKNCLNKSFSIFNLFQNKHHIDHIDGDHSNNNPKNLQRLCASCHAKKTYDQTKDRRIDKSIKTSIKIFAYKKDDKNYKKEFLNSVIASEELQLSRSEITKNYNDYEKNNKLKWIGSNKHINKYRFEKIKTDNIEGEIWKDVTGLDYQVSNKGRVKNKSRVSYGNIENINFVNIGFRIQLNDKKKYQVHILIMKTFKNFDLIEKAKQIKKKFKYYPECKDMSIEDIIKSNGKRYSIVVDHIDRNPKNNILENLRWSTIKENNENTKNIKKIEQWSIDKKILINTFSSQAEAGRQTDIDRRSICSVCNRNRKSAGGYFWKFKDD